MEGSALRRQAIAVRLAFSMLLAFPLGLAGCSGILQTKKVVYAGTQGSVTLEEIVDWSFEASHPSSVDPSTLTRVLEGVRIGQNEGTPAYSPEDIAFLAPLLSTALSRAKVEHVVAFHLTSDAARQRDITGGTVYIKGPALYLTPIPIHGAGPTSSVLPASKSGTHLTNSQGVRFEPHSVVRTAPATSDVALGHTRATSLVIDHRTLAKLATAPPPPPAPLTFAPAVEPVQKPAGPTVIAPSVTSPPTSAPAQTHKPHVKAPAPNSRSATRRTKPASAKKSPAKSLAAPKAVVRPVKPKPVPPPPDHAAILEVLKKAASPETPELTKER